MCKHAEQDDWTVVVSGLSEPLAIEIGGHLIIVSPDEDGNGSLTIPGEAGNAMADLLDPNHES